MTKYDKVRETFTRAHNNLFGGSRYEATFFNYPDPGDGDYDPDTGEISEGSRSSFGTENIEIVSPSQDSSVDVDGTNFSWDTSIRFPQTDGIVGSLTTLGEDNKRPTEVEITDQEDNSTVAYELHSYTTEIGSGFIMARLVEQ